MWRLILFIVFLPPPLRAQAQSIQISGGDSSLLNAVGAQATAYWSTTSTTSLGLGEFNGHLLPSLTQRMDYRGWTTVVGNEQESLSVDGGGIGAPLAGVSVERSGLKLFAGGIGQSYCGLFASGSTVRHFGGGYQFKRTVHGVRFTSIGGIAGNQRTVLENASYHRTWLDLSGTGGWLQNAPLLNGQAGLHLRHVGVVTSRQTLVLPARTFTVSTVAASGQWKYLSGNAGRISAAQSGLFAGLGATFKAVTAQSIYYRSGKSATVSHTVTERYRRWTLSQSVSEASGRTTWGIGGSYQSNRLAVSVNHVETFSPLSGWRSVMSVSLRVRVHDTDLHYDTVTDPTGKVGYTGYASQWLYGQEMRPHDGGGLGKYLISGIVVDERGEPIEGAAVRVGRELMWTGANGTFQLSVKKNRPVLLAVITEEFTAPGLWVCASCPANAIPDLPVRIVIRRSS